MAATITADVVSRVAVLIHLGLGYLSLSRATPTLSPGEMQRLEHDTDVIANSDWIIDLGPGGGADGGNIVAVGPPAVVARATISRTAPYLAARLKR